MNTIIMSRTAPPARASWRCRLGFHRWLDRHADSAHDVLTCGRCGRVAYLDTTLSRWGEPNIGHTTYVGHPT